MRYGGGEAIIDACDAEAVGNLTIRASPPPAKATHLCLVYWEKEKLSNYDFLRSENIWMQIRITGAELRNILDREGFPSVEDKHIFSSGSERRSYEASEQSLRAGIIKN